MGKPTGKKKKPSGTKIGDASSKHRSKTLDADANIFIDMANELKEDGNKLFQKRDYERALLKYEKAIKLLPKSHIDAAYLRSNNAACYMQMSPPDYYRAINECNLALEVSPKYTKALLKRARCFEALDRPDLASRDVDKVLNLEPNNLTALEISERVKKVLEEKGIELNDKVIVSCPEVVQVKEKPRKKKTGKAKEKVAVEEAKDSEIREEEPMKVMKLILGEDIRWAQVPVHCSTSRLKEIVLNKFPSVKAALVKYKDKEGDMVTITVAEELRLAEESSDPQGSVRLYIAEIKPEQDPFFGEVNNGSSVRGLDRSHNSISEIGSIRHDEERGLACIDDWIVQFARLFKNHVGINSDACLDLHELGMKLYSEAIEDTVTSEEAHVVFQLAEEKFQEMTALALFNWGNVHMSRARKRLFTSEDASNEVLLAQIKIAYEWAREEYAKAGERYEEALKTKPDFYEGLLALGQQKFEQAKLSWYYALASNEDLETWPSSFEVLELFNSAEDNIERGMEMWEEFEKQRLKDLFKPSKENTLLQKIGCKGYIKDVSTHEAAELASNMRSQINILWGTMLYERSVVEFKLGLPIWEECLMEAVEKFKLTGASQSDVAVMIKNHCANEAAQDGLVFKIDEIVQAWNEMYDAKRWMRGVPSFRLEPLLRLGVPKLHNALENIQYP